MTTTTPRMPVHSDGRADLRYTADREGTGHQDGPRYVARFCGERIGDAADRAGAAALAVAHAAGRELHPQNVAHLALSWGVSRGRETEGYTICRLRDESTGKVYRCMGGGYDLTGTVFGAWLQDVHQDRLRQVHESSYAVFRAGQGYAARVNPGPLYGMTAHYSAASAVLEAVHLDGACGLDSMLKIAKAIGLEVTREYGRAGRNRGNTTGWIVTTP